MIDKVLISELGSRDGLQMAAGRMSTADKLAWIDALAAAGLGGCPFAPGASGNIVTEDLVHMVARMGVETGIDLDRLLAARAVLARALPGEPLYGYLPGRRQAGCAA